MCGNVANVVAVVVVVVAVVDVYVVVGVVLVVVNCYVVAVVAVAVLFWMFLLFHEGTKPKSFEVQGFKTAPQRFKVLKLSSEDPEEPKEEGGGPEARIA